MRNVKKTIANSPDESNTNTPGSGASGEDGGRIGPPPPPTGPPVTAQSDWKASTMLLSSVTEPVRDMTLPQPIVAPVCRTLPEPEIIVPRNVVVVPRVAALPTAHVMLPVNRPALPVFTTRTPEALAVVSANGI